MKRRYQCILFAALLVFLISLPSAMAVECPPEGPDAEPLYEGDHFFMGKLEGKLVMIFQNREGGRDITATLEKPQAAELLDYARKARDAAPGMNPFAAMGDAQVPKPQRPIEPLLLNSVGGEAIWAHVAGHDYRNGSFFAEFLLAHAGSGDSPDSRYMLKLKIYETPPTYPKEEILIDKDTGQPMETPEAPGPSWGEEFKKFLAGLEAFTGSKLLIIG